jgi:hypothetical protein
LPNVEKKRKEAERIAKLSKEGAKKKKATYTWIGTFFLILLYFTTL